MIYIASKAKHGGRWQELRARGWPINSTWIDEHGPNETRDHRDLWERCISEACDAQVLICYREPGEVLKGALVEMGAAIARGRYIICVGFNSEEGRRYTIVNHRLCVPAKDIETAFMLAGTVLESKGWSGVIR